MVTTLDPNSPPEAEQGERPFRPLVLVLENWRGGYASCRLAAFLNWTLPRPGTTVG